jgi:hypothetical protein
LMGRQGGGRCPVGCRGVGPVSHAKCQSCGQESAHCLASFHVAPAPSL